MGILRAVDVGPVLHEINSLGLYVKHTVHEINSVVAALPSRFSEIAEEIRTVKTEVDFSPVLNKEIDFTEVIGEIRRIKKEIDFTGLLSQLTKLEVAMKPEPFNNVIEEIRRVKSEIDFTPVLADMQKVKINVNPQSFPEPDYTHLVNEIHKVKNEIDFSALLDEIQNIEVNVKPGSIHAKILGEIEKAKTDVDLSPVLDGVRKIERSLQPGRSCPLDAYFTQLADEVRTMKTEIDFSRVFSAINDATANVKHPVVQEVRQLQTAVDSRPILKAIHEATEETRKVKSDCSNVFAAIQELEANIKSIIPDVVPVINEVRRVKSEIDFSAVLSAIQKINLRLVDLAPAQVATNNIKVDAHSENFARVDAWGNLSGSNWLSNYSPK